MQILCKYLEGVLTHCRGLETHGQLHHGLVFHRVQVLLFCQEATPVAAQEPGKLEKTVDRVAPQLPHLDAARVFRFWFFWPWRPSTGIHHCHSSRPSDGTDAPPTDVANPRGYGSYIQDRSWTSTTASAADTCSSAELYTGQSERLTMDTKWIPAAPLPDWKSWDNKAKSWLVSRVG